MMTIHGTSLVSVRNDILYDAPAGIMLCTNVGLARAFRLVRPPEPAESSVNEQSNSDLMVAPRWVNHPDLVL